MYTSIWYIYDLSQTKDRNIEGNETDTSTIYLEDNNRANKHEDKHRNTERERDREENRKSHIGILIRGGIKD